MESIRKIQRKDNRALADLIRTNLKERGLDIPGTVYFDAGLDQLYEYYSGGGSSRNFYVLLDEDGEVAGCIGYAAFTSMVDTAELQKLYLNDKVKGRGLGYRLISFIEERMLEAGFRKSYLETHSNLTIAMHLYKRCGYHEIPRPESVNHSTMDHFFIKELENKGNL